MKTPSKLSSAARTFVSIALTNLHWIFCSSVSCAAPFTNGDFEASAGATMSLPVGSTSLQGWTIGGNGGPISWVNSLASAQSGAHYLTFNSGDQPAGTLISQTFDTVIGQTYQVGYFVTTGGNGNSVSITASAKSQAGSLLGQKLSAPVPAAGWGAVQLLLFTATSTATTLEFLDTSALTIKTDIALDNVTVLLSGNGSKSISGTILVSNPPAGTIRITATSTTIGATGFATLTAPATYTIGPLPGGQSYNVTAYVDGNGNQIRDPYEWTGKYAFNPLLLTNDKSDVHIAILIPVDTDGDGMSDEWELANGLNPNSAIGVDGSSGDKDGDGLTNIHEYYLGTKVNLADTNGDGVPDGVAYAAGMNPLSADTDGDGMPDKWEMDDGLNPLVNDAAMDADGDGLTNLEEYNAGTNPRVIHTFPADGFSTDYDRVKGTGIKSNTYTYDADDRLIATYYSNGAWEAWRYDGNGNILAHTLKTVRDADGDGLPDAWELANGLSFAPVSGRAGTQGFAGDADGDGWTNYQEYLAGTDPKNAASHPPTGGVAGAAWFNPPKSRIILPPASGTGLSHVWVKLWDADGNASQVALQWFDAAAQQWKPATLTRVDGAVFVAGSAVAAPPAGMTHDLLWNAQANLGNFNGIVLLRTTAQDAAGMTTSETVPFTVNTTGTPPNSIIVPSGGSVTTDGGTYDSIVINDGGTLTLGGPPGSPAPSLETVTSAAASAAVTCAAEMNVGNGKTYLTVSYQRRADLPSLIYEIQTTTDLATWITAGADAEQIGRTTSGNMQTVKVRIYPPIGTPGTPVKFVRLRVRTP